MVQQPDFEPKGEFSIHIQSGPIFDEVSRDLVIWQENRDSGFRDNLGSQVRLQKLSPLLDFAIINAGTGFLSKYNASADFDLSAQFGLNEQTVKDINAGYLNEPLVKRLSEMLAVRLTDISLQDRYLVFNSGSQRFNLYLGPSSLESALESWRKSEVGVAPTFNSYLRLSLDEPSARVEFLQDREQFIQLCTQFSTVSGIVISSLHQIYGQPMPKLNIEVLSPDNQRIKDQQSRGYSVTTYEEGEFHWDGSKAEPIYNDLDRLVWEKHQRIVQNRGLGNRQIVTIRTDQLVFGRWAGLSAGEEQADVLIDEDVKDLDVTGERAVSRRHFAVYFNQEINEIVEKESKGLINDLPVVQDLRSLNGVTIFRRTSLARQLFQRNYEELNNGQWLLILPGDLLLITPASYKKEDLDKFGWFEPKGVGLVYLGNRRFVKLLLDATSSKEFLQELVSVIAPSGEGARMQDLVNQLTDPKRKTFDNLDQFTQVVRDFQESRRGVAIKLTEEMVIGETADDLLKILGTSTDNLDIKLNNARLIMEKRLEEPHLVSYALLQLISAPDGVENLTATLTQNQLWKKISTEVCLHVVDLVEASKLASEVKKEILHTAFMARDDVTRDIIRPLLEKYS